MMAFLKLIYIDLLILRSSKWVNLIIHISCSRDGSWNSSDLRGWRSRGFIARELHIFMISGRNLSPTHITHHPYHHKPSYKTSLKSYISLSPFLSTLPNNPPSHLHFDFSKFIINFNYLSYLLILKEMTSTTTSHLTKPTEDSSLRIQLEN